MQAAKLAGWVNITNEVITEKSLAPGVTTLNPPRTRQNLTSKVIFLTIISKKFLQHCATAASSQARLEHEGKPGIPPTFNEDDILGFVQMIVMACATGVKKWADFVRDPKRKGGLTRRKMESLSKYFGFAPEELIPTFNEALQKVISV
jgi:hypothetical protein